jgi:ankyrin repeat protein
MATYDQHLRGPTAGQTPLLMAVERGHGAAAALLLIHGSDPDAADNKGRGRVWQI